jgi:hypothetical protein
LFKGIKMALNKTISLKNNFGTETTIQNAYIRVDGLIIKRKHAITGERLVEIAVSINNDESSPALEKRGHFFALDLSGSNPLDQAYQFLKTMPDYAGATDC